MLRGPAVHIDTDLGDQPERAVGPRPGSAVRSTPPHSVNKGERISNDGVWSCRLLVGLGLREAGRSLPGGSHWAWSAWTRASICCQVEMLATRESVV